LIKSEPHSLVKH